MTPDEFVKAPRPEDPPFLTNTPRPGDTDEQIAARNRRRNADIQEARAMQNAYPSSKNERSQSCFEEMSQFLAEYSTRLVTLNVELQNLQAQISPQLVAKAEIQPGPLSPDQQTLRGELERLDRTVEALEATVARFR